MTDDRIVVVREEDQWAAVALDYSIVGIGPSEAAARADCELWLSEMREGDGLPLNPVGRRWRISIWRRQLIGRITPTTSPGEFS
jgi:hypothetical protein